MNFEATHKKTVVKMATLKRLIVESAPPKTVVVPSNSKAPTDPLFEKMFPVTRSKNQKKAKKNGESFYDDDDYRYSKYLSLEHNIDLKKKHLQKIKEEKERERRRRR